MYLGAIKIFSVYSMYHNTVSLRIEIISLKKIEKRRVMDWHLLFPMSCVSSSTWDEELFQVLSCPVIQFQLLQVQKAEIEHLPLTSDPSGQEIKGKEGSYQIISRDSATQTETSHSDQFFSAVCRPSAGLLCGTVQKDSWESCRLWGIKEAFAKEGNSLLMKKVYLMSTWAITYMVVE